MSSTLGSSFQDKTLNKVAVCSAVFAGFAYVGYSYARTAFCRKLVIKNLDNDDEQNKLQLSQIVFRRLSQTNHTDALLGNLDQSVYPGRLIIRPKSVQERIRELNVKARQFTDAFIAIQSGNGHGTNAISRSSAMHGPISIQCSPCCSPRLLSPVDVRHFIISRSTENLTHIPMDSSPSRPKWVRKSIRRKKSGCNRESEKNLKIRLKEEALELLQNIPEELILRLEELSTQAGILTPYEARSLVALLYSRDTHLIEKTLITIANCSAFSVNLDFFREVGCIHRLCALLEDQDVRLCAVQTLGNVILLEENIREARDCLPFLMEFLQNNCRDDALKLASLIVLTNLATTSVWHEEFCAILPRLYQLVDSTNVHMQLQSLRLLINLSCNRDMIPALLEAEGPINFEIMVSKDTPDALLLRTLTLAAILATAVKYKLFDTLSTLSAEQHSMYNYLFGVCARERMMDKVLDIIDKHEDLEINHQASKLYEALKE